MGVYDVRYRTDDIRDVRIGETRVEWERYQPEVLALGNGKVLFRVAERLGVVGVDVEWDEVNARPDAVTTIIAPYTRDNVL